MQADALNRAPARAANLELGVHIYAIRVRTGAFEAPTAPLEDHACFSKEVPKFLCFTEAGLIPGVELVHHFGSLLHLVLLEGDLPPVGELVKPVLHPTYRGDTISAFIAHDLKVTIPDYCPDY